MTPTQPPQGVMAELRELLARRSAAAERIARSPVYIDDILAFDEAHDAARDAALKALPGLLDEVEALRADAVSLRNQRDLFRQEHERQHARASALLARCEGLEADARRWRYTQQAGYFATSGLNQYGEDMGRIAVGVKAPGASLNSSIRGKGKTLQEAIDAALAATRTTGGESP